MSNRLTRRGGCGVLMRVLCCLRVWCDATHHGGHIAVNLYSGLVWSHGAISNNTLSIAPECRKFNRDWGNFRIIDRNLGSGGTALDNGCLDDTFGRAKVLDS